MKDFKVGLQLYSVRGDMEKDFFGTLKAVKEAGYDYVEFAGYYNHTAKEIKAELDRLGLCCPSVHQGPDLFLQQGQEAVDFIKTLGVKYAAVPWYGIENYQNGNFDATIEKFRTVGELLKKNGIQLTYHNHDFEFNYLDGEFILEKIYKALPDIEGEVDTCWCRYAGVDPAAFIEKYAGRMHTLHLKDFTCRKLAAGPVYALIDDSGKAKAPESKEDNGFAFRPLGLGMQDFPAILAAAEKAGTDYVIVEQDESKDMPALDAARISREYLRSLGL
jgi:sugar phosphate isomerase/epimerase